MSAPSEYSKLSAIIVATLERELATVAVRIAALHQVAEAGLSDALDKDAAFEAIQALAEGAVRQVDRCIERIGGTCHGPIGEDLEGSQ